MEKFAEALWGGRAARAKRTFLAAAASYIAALVLASWLGGIGMLWLLTSAAILGIAMTWYSDGAGVPIYAYAMAVAFSLPFVGFVLLLNADDLYNDSRLYERFMVWRRGAW